MPLSVSRHVSPRSTQSCAAWPTFWPLGKTCGGLCMATFLGLMLVAQFDSGSEGRVLFPCSRPSSAVSSYKRIPSSSSCPPRLERILSAFLKSHLLKTKCWPPLFPQDSHDVPPKPAGVSPGLYFLVTPLPTSHVFVGPLMSPSSLYLRLFHCGPFLPLSPNIYFLFFFFNYCFYISHRKKKKKKKFTV